ncbi:virulence-associated E family protein [Anaerotignum lactatifermentans]|uniref:virulence-associated E family protein n=1 Tax=Anaerotignum lactatifermentans TaxID=160404 RepID=UPI00248D7A05|nr:virulence-associated E family protein [Anaerotignum lactatifermentans]
MRTLRIATGNSRTTKIWKNTTFTWEALVERLSTTSRTPESQGEYKNMTKSQQDKIKDIGGFVAGKLKNGSRKAENVESRDIITLDADFAAVDFCDQLDIFLSCAWCVYSTHKHTPEKPRLRLLIPLDRSATAEEYEAVARKIADNIGIDQFDDTTYQPHRLMYWPSTSMDGEYVFRTGKGEFLSVDSTLQQYKDWTDVSEWPVSGRTLQRKDRLLKKQEDPCSKNGIVGAFCRTYNVEEAMEKFLPGVYVPCAMEDRYTYAAGSTAAGAVIYDDGKFIYSNHATDPAGGVLCNAFDLVRLHKFRELDEEAAEGTPTVKLPSYLEMRELASNDAEVRMTLHKEKLAGSQKDFAGISIAEDEDDDSWVLEMDVDGKGNYMATIHNAKMILSHDPLLKGKIRKNEFTKKYRVFGALPWNTDERERDWEDNDDSGLRYYIEKVYQIKGKANIEDAWGLVANENRYHPVRDYLESLVWDGVPRVETLFIEFMGAEDNAYTRAVSRIALTAAVARIFAPGIKYDNVVVLVGPQGCGKSTILKKLGRDWFSDTLTTMQGKEAYEQIQGFWIIEIGELAAMKRYEVETVKQFTSKSEDSYRAAYGHHVETHKRQCVFFGTTNTYDFLKDMTGNRRFFPVDVHPEKAAKDVWNDLDAKTVDQIWAEAVSLFRNGEKFYLWDEDIKRMAEEVQDSHLEESPLAGAVLAFLDKKIPKNWDEIDLCAKRDFIRGESFVSDIKGEVYRDKVCALEIWCELFNGERKDLTRQKSKEINDIIEKTGEWVRAKSTFYLGTIYGHQRGFTRKNKTL